MDPSCNTIRSYLHNQKQEIMYIKPSDTQKELTF